MSKNDWVREFILKQCKFKNSDGKLMFDVNLLIKLAEINGVDDKYIKKFRKQSVEPKGPGQVTMGISQMLRARARRRHGLYTLKKRFTKASEEWCKLTELTETKDGEKIKPKTTAKKTKPKTTAKKTKPKTTAKKAA